jgi:hypothetical protein
MFLFMRLGPHSIRQVGPSTMSDNYHLLGGRALLVTKVAACEMRGSYLFGWACHLIDIFIRS